MTEYHWVYKGGQLDSHQVPAIELISYSYYVEGAE